ncbi:retrovirus-related pol polyprotein from transposon TNT 1-94 [Tanacetum coccineum]
MEYLVNISKRRAFWSLNEDILKITILKTNTLYPSRKIRRIRACTHQRPQRNKAQYAVSREDRYAVLEIWNEYNILEDIKRGPYSKKSPIRRIQSLDTPKETARDGKEKDYSTSDLEQRVCQNGVTRTKKYAKLTVAEKIQADYDIKATNIILQGFAVPVFSLGDDPIACLNKAMAFLTAIASSSNATSSRGNNASGHARVVKCYNCQGERHMARQCTQPKRPRNESWYKDKAMLAEAQEAGQVLNEEKLAFLADPGVPDGQAVQTIIPNNTAF